jgi:hypothetical protein
MALASQLSGCAGEYPAVRYSDQKAGEDGLRKFQVGHCELFNVGGLKFIAIRPPNFPYNDLRVACKNVRQMIPCRDNFSFGVKGVTRYAIDNDAGRIYVDTPAEYVALNFKCK